MSGTARSSAKKTCLNTQSKKAKVIISRFIRRVIGIARAESPGQACCAPFLPLDPLGANQSLEHFGQTPAAQGDGKLALLLNSLVLGLEDEARQSVDEGVCGRERVQYWWTGIALRHYG